MSNGAGRSPRRALLVAGFLLLWLFTVIAAYYVAHKPFTVANLVAVGRALAGLAGASLVMALGVGVGLVLLRRVEAGPLERLVLAAGAGLGAVSLAGLGLGALGLLRSWLLWLLTGAGLAVTGVPLWRALRAARAEPNWLPQSRFAVLLAIYCGSVLGIALLWSLTPPFAWDGLVYHLTGPKLYLQAGRVSYPFDLPHLGFPQLVEMLFAWGMGLTGERAAAPIHWFYGALEVLALVAVGRRRLGGSSGWIAAAVFASAPSIVLLAGWPYVDLALVFYFTLAFVALGRFCDSGDRIWLGLGGLFAGLALSTKYTALALLPALGLALLVDRIRNPRAAIGGSLILGVVALAVWLPWLLKNLWLTDNPVYPFFSGLFGGVHWDDWRAWWYDRPGTGLAKTDPWRLLTAPWDATIWGIEGAAVKGVPSYGATVGPLLLALLPVLALVWRRLPTPERRWLRGALIACGVLCASWLYGLARSALLIQTRLLFPAFGMVSLLAAAAVHGVRRGASAPVDLAWLARAAIVAVLALTLAATFMEVVRQRPLGVLLGFESEEGYLSRRLGWYRAAVVYINRELPPDGVVLFLWEPRSYHCEIACRPDAILDRWLHATQALHGRDAHAIADAWRAEGVTHVLLSRAGYEAVREGKFDPLTDADVDALEELQHSRLSEVRDFGGIYVLYELQPR